MNHNHNGHSSPPFADAETFMQQTTPFTAHSASPFGENQSSLDKTNTDNLQQQNDNPPDDQPDFWNYLLVAILSFFYLASLVSTFISAQMLLYLLSGGGILIPLFGTRIPITEAVGLMGSGLLEGASLGDAYLEHKQQLSGGKKWLSRGGRAFAFIGQWLLYYMALGTLLFATIDVTTLGTSDLETAQPEEEAVLVLNPPSVLHGLFVATLTGAWSYASNYAGIDALFYAISRIRKRKKQDHEENDLEFFLELIAELQERMKDYEMAKEMETLAQQLKQVYTQMDGMRTHSDLSDVFYQKLTETIAKIPEAKLKQKNISRQQLQEKIAETLLSHPSLVSPAPFSPTPPKTPPKNWFQG